MALGPASRVNYFDGQFIRLAELQDEQAYHLQLRRRHNLSHHSWGIVLGLEIVREQDGRPAVRPGLAVDGYGRELLLLERQVFGREVFDRYGTSRLDLWLEYQRDMTSDRWAPVECGGGDPRARYRAVERAQIVPTRGGARPDPRHPPGVPFEAFDPPMLATPDEPTARWPVYLGRIIMVLPASGPPKFEIDTADRVYVGLNAEVIDHPGNAARLELGRRPTDPDTRRVDKLDVTYQKGPTRDFAVFVPSSDDPLQPTIAVYDEGTQIRGTTTVYGNVVLDGASLQFPAATNGDAPATGGDPAIYRFNDPTFGDEMRIDIGELAAANRRFVLGVTKDKEFHPAIEITFPTGTAVPVVIVHGDLRIEGLINARDMRVRTVTEEVAALLTGMVQSGMAQP